MDESVSARLKQLIGPLGTEPEDRPLCRFPTVATVTRSAVDTHQVLAALKRNGWEAYTTGKNVIYIRTDNAPPEHQPREHPVPCKFASQVRPHFTTNHDAVCDDHRGLTDRGRREAS